MIITGALENCIKKGRDYLKLVITSSNLSPTKLTFALLKQVIDEQEQFQKEVIATREIFEGMRVHTFGKYSNWLKKLSLLPEVKKELKKVERRLTIVAQSS